MMAALLDKILWLSFWSSVLFFRLSAGLENKLARTPPMGWLAWERFTCEIDCSRYPDDCINERLFEQQARHLLDDGYSALGYTYVNIDDCWSEHERDARTEQLVANRTRFPAGIRSLADKLHQMGLKLGIYGDCGMKTCAGYPAQIKPSGGDTVEAMRNHNYFQVDADTLREWQVDSFKFDGCHIDPLKAEQVCPLFSSALTNVKRPAKKGDDSDDDDDADTGKDDAPAPRPVLLVCEWPFYLMYAHQEADFALASKSCNVWRYYDDIEDSWQSVLNTIDYSVKHQSTIVKFHGPGHWFDPDQLVVGNFGLSVGQANAQMAMWALWSAPLYMSNDLRHIKPEFAAILKNERLIQVNQDRLGVFGLMVAESSDKQVQVFAKPVEPISNQCPSFVLVLLNRATLGNTRKVAFKLRDLLVGSPIKQAAKNQMLSEHDDTNLIDANVCLRRLTSLAPTSTSTSTSTSTLTSTAGHFKATDLIRPNAHVPDLGLDDDLRLSVAPSSVRALKLVEISQPDCPSDED